MKNIGIDVEIESENGNDVTVSFNSFNLKSTKNGVIFIPERTEAISNVRKTFSVDNEESLKKSIEDEINNIKADNLIIYAVKGSNEESILEKSVFRPCLRNRGISTLKKDYSETPSNFSKSPENNENKTKRNVTSLYGRKNRESKPKIEIESKEKIVKNPENAIFIDVVSSHDLRYKSSYLHMSGYKDRNSLEQSENSLFTQYIFSNKSPSVKHQNFVENMIPHIAKANNENKEVLIRMNIKDLPYSSVLNKALKDKGFENVSYDYVNPFENELKESENHKRLVSFVNAKYERLLKNKDQILLFTDGSYLGNSNNRGHIGAGYIIKHGSDEYEKGFGKEAVNSYEKNSNGSEAYAILKALQDIRKLDLKTKNINIVVDSDFMAKSLDAIKDKEKFPHENKWKPILDKIKQIIDDEGFSISSTVIKSHQSLNKKSNNYHRKIVSLNDRVDALASKARKNSYKSVKNQISDKEQKKQGRKNV